MLFCSFVMLLAHLLNSDSTWFQLHRNVKVVMFHFSFISFHISLKLNCCVPSQWSCSVFCLCWSLTSQLSKFIEHQCFCCLAHQVAFTEKCSVNYSHIASIQNVKSYCFLSKFTGMYQFKNITGNNYRTALVHLYLHGKLLLKLTF